MIFEFIIYALSSLLIIYSIHNLYNYLKNTYTTKKTKDLVVFHLNKYQDILETVKTKQNKIQKEETHINQQNENINDNCDDDDDDATEIEFISNNEKYILQNSLMDLINMDSSNV